MISAERYTSICPRRVLAYSRRRLAERPHRHVLGKTNRCLCRPKIFWDGSHIADRISRSARGPCPPPHFDGPSSLLRRANDILLECARSVISANLNLQTHCIGTLEAGSYDTNSSHSSVLPTSRNQDATYRRYHISQKPISLLRDLQFSPSFDRRPQAPAGIGESMKHAIFRLRKIHSTLTTSPTPSCPPTCPG